MYKVTLIVNKVHMVYMYMYISSTYLLIATDLDVMLVLKMGISLDE